MKNVLKVAYLMFVMNWNRERLHKIVANTGLGNHDHLMWSNPTYKNAFNKYESARKVLKELGEVTTA
jgi:hypothetical protein